MKVGQIVTSISGDKKGLQGEVLAIDQNKERVQVQWPRGYMKTWVKISTVN